MKTRIKIILVLFGLFWIILISRLYYLSIKSNRYYEELALQNVIKTEYLLPNRGEIRDINNTLLAVSKLGFSISLKAHLSRKKKVALNENLKIIKSYFPKLNIEKLKSKYLKNDSPYNHKPIKLVSFIPYDEMILHIVKLAKYEDIVIKPSSKRFYPNATTVSHIVGYVSKANERDIKEDEVVKMTSVAGKIGIEKQYNKILEGEPGKRILKVTASNKPIEALFESRPKSKNITLTIDMRVQKYIESLFKGKSGAVIVMNAKNGAILAAGSYPTYNINHFVEGISHKEWNEMINNLDHPFTNKFTRGLYPPGSATKPAVALSFLNSRLIDKNEEFLCTGEMEVGKRKFRCWKQKGHGLTDMKKAIKESCDVYFYKGGLRVGIDKIATDLKRYGFEKKTGIDLPGEFIGTVPNRNWKVEKFGQSWYKGETLNTVIGQGNFLVTPIQIALFTASVATGKEPVPHFLKKVDEKTIKFETKEIFNDFEKKELPYIRESMFEVCNRPFGTAYKYNISAVTMAGKTGTSQVIGIPQQEKERMSENELKFYQKSHAWFTTFAPYEDPKYVVTVLIEHGGHGGAAAGEIVSKIYNKLVKIGYIDKKFVKNEWFLDSLDKNKTLKTVPTLD